MNSAFPWAPLATAITQRKASVLIDDLRTYKRCRVQLHAQGIVLRDAVLGAEIKTKKQQVCRAGDFLVAEIDAKVGGFGIVPAALDGAIVSSHYFLFEVDPSRLDRQYLEFFIQTRAFFDQVTAQGSTNYAAIRPADVLSYKIPFPPIREQQELVDRVRKLHGKIDQAKRLRQAAQVRRDATLAAAVAAAFAADAGWAHSRVGELCTPPQYGYTESASALPVGPRFLRITDIQDGRVDWKSVPYCHCPQPERYLLDRGDIVFARTGATTGKSFLITACPERAVFASYLIRVRVRRDVTPEYLYAYFQSPQYWRQIADERVGTGQGNVNGKKLASILVPVPPPTAQAAIVEYVERVQESVNQVKRLQASSEEDIDAMMGAVLRAGFEGRL